MPNDTMPETKVQFACAGVKVVNAAELVVIAVGEACSVSPKTGSLPPVTRHVKPPDSSADTPPTVAAVKLYVPESEAIASFSNQPIQTTEPSAASVKAFQYARFHVPFPVGAVTEELVGKVLVCQPKNTKAKTFAPLVTPETTGIAAGLDVPTSAVAL